MTSPQNCGNCWHRVVHAAPGKPDVTHCRVSQRFVNRTDLCEDWQQGVPPEDTYREPLIQIGPTDV